MLSLIVNKQQFLDFGSCIGFVTLLGPSFQREVVEGLPHAPTLWLSCTCTTSHSAFRTPPTLLPLSNPAALSLSDICLLTGPVYTTQKDKVNRGDKGKVCLIHVTSPSRPTQRRVRLSVASGSGPDFGFGQRPRIQISLFNPSSTQYALYTRFFTFLSSKFVFAFGADSISAMAAQTAVEVASADRVEPGSFPLRLATLPAPSPVPHNEVQSIAEAWVSSFNETLKSPSLDNIANVFLSESYWRDQLCLSWDFHCLQGPEKVYSLFKSSKGGCRMKSVCLDASTSLRAPIASAVGDSPVIRAFLTVETDVGHGKGVLRLVNENGKWKAFTLFTFLQGLNGQEEVTGKKRPNGVQHGEHVSRANWQDQRKAEEAFEGDQEPTVIIVGKYPMFYNGLLIDLSSQVPASRVSLPQLGLRC